MKFIFETILFCLFCVCFSGCSSYSSSDLIYVASLKAEKKFWNWESEDIQVHYVEKGKGDRHVLLLHGFGANTYTWNQQIDLLAKKGYRVWALDWVGFGFSDKPLDVDYNLDLYRRQAIEFMDAMGIQKAHLVANSMGGAVALALAESNPNRVSSLVLIDPLAYPIELPFIYSVGKKLGGLIKPFFSRERVYKTLKEIYHDPERITEEQVDAYWLPYRMEGGREAVVKLLKSFDLEVLDSLQKGYRDLKMPLLLIWGENDEWIPVSQLEDFSRDFPKAKQNIIPCCGHTPQEEKPEAVNPLLIQFLSSLYTARD